MGFPPLRWRVVVSMASYNRPPTTGQVFLRISDCHLENQSDIAQEEARGRWGYGEMGRYPMTAAL